MLLARSGTFLGYMTEPLGISFIIATRNRREVLLETVTRLGDCGVDGSRTEIIVVDNASTDGTAAALSRDAPDIRVIALPDNRGSCAKALALPDARYRYVMHVDDDSWPLGDSIPLMLDRFERTPSLAAAGFVARLPDERIECSALPDVFIGCGVGLRTSVLRQVGGIDEWFFMQAEEYDLAFRLANAGHQVRVFEDLQVRHLKTPQARYRGTTAYYDTRNNIVLACRFLSGPWLRAYLSDWIQRYAWLSKTSDNLGAFAKGVAAGFARAGRERLGGRSRPLSPRAFEAFFRVSQIENKMRELHMNGVRRILLADLGKNILAFRRAAKLTGIEVVAIAADHFAKIPGRRYRGTPILPTDQALGLDFDAIVIANTSHAHAADRAEQIARLDDRTVHDWFGWRPNRKQRE